MSGLAYRLELIIAVGGLALSGPLCFAKKIKVEPPVPSRYLYPKDLGKLKKEKCVFVHVWATWCSVCMEEMPDLIKMLKNTKKVKPIIIDVSSINVQESFSKRWMQQLRPAFPTYLKPPDIKDEIYLDAVDKSFSGTLPFSALFHRGRTLQKWTGSLDLKGLAAEFQNLCID